MEHEELLDYIRTMFIDVQGGTSSLTQMVKAMNSEAEGGENVTKAEIRAVCDVLVAEGMIELVGKDTYDLTAAFAESLKQEEREWFSELVAEHTIKKAARK